MIIDITKAPLTANTIADLKAKADARVSDLTMALVETWLAGAIAVTFFATLAPALLRHAFDLSSNAIAFIILVSGILLLGLMIWTMAFINSLFAGAEADQKRLVNTPDVPCADFETFEPCPAVDRYRDAVAAERRSFIKAEIEALRLFKASSQFPMRTEKERSNHDA